MIKSQQLIKSGRSFERGGFDIKDHFKYSFGSFPHSIPEEIKIRINAGPKDFMWTYLRESLIHPSAAYVVKNGARYLDLKVGVDHDLAGWILSWGEKMTVIEPKELFTIICDVKNLSGQVGKPSTK